uniref:Uncharacterized protein n=1 Tax=Megaviridae environmental sample TaxID=1737588 RepID=A0A5J6VH66_9VIRU|nr:MAG: hypothetical protein [Megaviridae environmental sample]
MEYLIACIIAASVSYITYKCIRKCKMWNNHQYVRVATRDPDPTGEDFYMYEENPWTATRNTTPTTNNTSYGSVGFPVRVFDSIHV